MKSLDDILSEQAQALHSQKVQEILDPTTWTTANRDFKMEEIRKVSHETADRAVELVKAVMLETELDGKPLLYWKILEQFMSAEIEFLLGFRDELDASPEETIATYPISYDWVTDAIRNRYKELGEQSIKLNAATSNEGSVEEL